MNKMRRFILTVMTFFLTITFCAARPEVRQYEAEQAVLADSIQVRNDHEASGGRYVFMPPNRGSVRFDVDVDSTARYRLQIRYRAADGDNAQHILINGKEYAPEIGFPISRSWTEITHAAGLKKGTNRIELLASWGNMDIDDLRVMGPVFDAPDITPVQNRNYRDMPRPELVFQLEKNHNPFTGVTLSGNSVPFTFSPVSYLEDAGRITLPGSFIQTLTAGGHAFHLNFSNTDPVVFTVYTAETCPPSDWTIIDLDVSHGTAVLMLLPSGRTLLIDTGTKSMCRERVIPFLDRHGLTLDELWITHEHNDHMGGRELLTEKFPEMRLKGYHDYHRDDRFDYGGVNVTILNSWEDGSDELGENSRSLSMRMEYRDFIYTHGGDIYASNQEQILKRYGERHQTEMLKTHVYHANHHFHGSVDNEYLRFIDPCLILVSGEEHIYGRGAYTHHVQKNVLAILKKNHKRLIEDLLAFEVGHVVIRITDGEHWTYETCLDPDAVFPLTVLSDK
ncbi:MBL fold metallo-hydrolase [bacterium]|nr:MBL fold metallo-hydrolase [bacterium]